MSTTIYADSWTGSATTGKVTQRAYMTYTVNQTATTYQIIVQSGVQQWNPTWTKIKTVCTLTDQSNVTKTLTQSSGANHLHQFFNVTYATITKTSSAQSKTITGTSKITGGVDSAHGSGTVLNKTSTVSHVFNIPAELKVSGSTLISKTFSTSEQTATLAATGGTSPYTFIELGEQGNTNYFSISGSTLKIAANTPVGNYAYRVKVKDADGVSISVDYTIKIAKANISPTVSMANWTYGGTASTPSVSGNSGNGTVTYHYKVSTAADSTYTTTKPSAAGTYTVRASVAATTNYNAGTATKNFTINKATPTLSVTGKTGLTYTGSAQALVSAWSVTGGGTVYLGIGSSSTTAPTSWTTNASPTATNAGTYYIWAKADTSTNYQAVAQVYKVQVVIAKKNISPSVTMANWAYGGTASNPSVSGNSGNGSVTYNYKLKSAANSAYSTTKPSDAGTYTIRASIAATTNYNAGTATKDFSITFTATPTAYSAQYNAAAHSASIKTSAPAVVVSYGTSTSYGNSVTCTNANTNYAMSSVTRTVTGTTTVYYSATKNGYTVTGSTTIAISNGTLTITPTAYNAAYNGAAHSASIKCTNVDGVTISYGTSTSYGQTLTATTKGTNYSMANVTRTDSGTTTVYYKASKTYYNDVTGSTTIVISKATPTLSVTGKTGLTYSGSAQALVSAWSVTGGGTVHLGLGSSSTTAPTSWTTNASPTATNAGTYYIWAKSDASTNYNAVSQVYKTSVAIAKATPTLSVTGVTVNYTGSAQTLVSASSVTGGGTIYYGLGSSSSSAPSSWSTTKPTATNVGTYYIWAKSDASTNYNAVSQVYKASATIKPVMWLKYHANGGTIADAPHKNSNTVYFKLNNSLVQIGSSATGTFSDYVLTINTSTTYSDFYNVSTFNITRTGYSIKSGTAAYNTAANGTGIDINQDNTAAGDTNPVTTKRLNGGTEITANVTKTLYVNWKANTYTVTLNANNGSGGTGSVTATYDAAMPSATMPTRAGYTFQGYYDTSAATGGTQYYTASGASARTWNKAAATTLYARWSVNTYTITLNANGGSGGTGSVNIVYGTAKGSYPSITKPTRTGYTFTGFYSATSGGTQWYDANGNSVRTFDLTANTIWYAQWTINSYTLTIDPNGGSWNNSTSVSTASQNYATAKSIAAPTRAGYTFVGWAETGPGHLSKINQTDPAFDSSSGGVAIYNNSGGGTVTHTRQSSSAGTAYGSYEILISASSGATSPGNGGFYQPTNSAANKKYIHAFVAKIPTGYTVEQACNATGNGRTITWLTDRYGTGGYRVYAYQHNCGSGGTFSTFGHVYLDTGSRPVSWQLAYSAMKDITDGTADTYTYGAGAGRITALWAGNKYSVAFNANGGSGSMTTQTDFFYGTAKALSANGFTAPSGGYSFMGWATSAANAAAGTVAYSNQGNMTTGTTTNGGTVTLYAVWRRTITFKHGKANATTSTVYQYYGGNLTPPTITAISTWTPLGWRDDTSASAKEYGANNTTAFAYTSTVQTLYAVYSRTLTISYGANGGTGTTPSNTTTTQYYNANGAITSPAVTLATNPYSQTGCTFSHWLVSTSNTNVASGGSYTWSIAVDASTVSRVASAQWNINVTATNGNATYNGSAHSASISIGIAGATVEYGTSTSYGYTLTATNANTNYSMSSVSATTVAQSTTVYYRVSKSGYLARTGSTTVTISKRTVTPTAPTLTTGTLTYDGTAKTLASAGSCTAGGQMYYYVGTSATAPAFSTSTWSTSISTETNAGTYYVFWYCYVSDTANNNDTSSDNINITKSLGSRTIGKATLTITPTAYSADYNGIAHSAQIKCTNADGVTIDYGTSTSYGNTLTATSKNTNYAMSSVTRTNPGTTTVHYKASKTNYNDVTSSTTITITGVPVHSNINGTWKHGIVYVNVNGTWKKATAGYRNVNGTWKPIDK